MDSSFLPKDEIWFLRLCHHISNAVYRQQSAWEWGEAVSTCALLSADCWFDVRRELPTTKLRKQFSFERWSVQECSLSDRHSVTFQETSIHTCQWRTEGVWGVQTFSEIPKAHQNRVRRNPICENCYKLLNLRRQHHISNEKEIGCLHKFLNTKNEENFTLWNDISGTKFQLPPEPLIRGLPHPDPFSLCPLSSNEFVEPPNKIPGYAIATCWQLWNFRTIKLSHPLPHKHVKFPVSLFVTHRQRRIRCVAVVILSFGTWGRWVVSFTAQPL